jgi:hypothetical protein
VTPGGRLECPGPGEVMMMAHDIRAIVPHTRTADRPRQRAAGRLTPPSHRRTAFPTRNRAHP